jgi:SAM-dependent methyltransferase
VHQDNAFAAATEARACSVCGGTGFRHLASEAGYDWEVCQDCDFVRLSNAFTFDEQVAIQDATYAANYIAKYDAKLDKKLARCRQRLKLITRHVQRGEFLDVGSNYGFMTEVAAQAGFQVTGLEINPGLAEHARKMYPRHRFVCSPLETFDPAGTRFDAVYCSEVIEHVIDPRRFLQSLAGLMRTGAVLLLTTPHEREYRRRRYTRMQAPDHKIYFNNANLRRLLTECGFEQVRFRFNPFKGIVLTACRS